MSESRVSQLFINAEQVGGFVNVRLPSNQGEGEDIALHYLESGVGEPMLLIHSLGQSLFTWRNVFADLSENYRVIALDLPGHGYSSRPETLAYTMDEMALLLRLFLDGLGIESTHIVAFSMGAMYALRFLSMFPEYAANCVLINPGGLTDRMPNLIHRIAGPLTSVFARNLFSAGDVRRLLYDCVYDEACIDDHVVKQYYEPLSDGLTREALMYALQNFDMDTVAHGLADVDHEVLVLWGKEDRWHPPSDSVYFQGVLRGGRYYLVRNTGHLLQEENPDKLLEVLYSYIPPAHPHYNVYRYTEDYADSQSAYQPYAYADGAQQPAAHAYRPYPADEAAQQDPRAYEQQLYEQQLYEQQLYERQIEAARVKLYEQPEPKPAPRPAPEPGPETEPDACPAENGEASQQEDAETAPDCASADDTENAPDFAADTADALSDAAADGEDDGGLALDADELTVEAAQQKRGLFSRLFRRGGGDA